VRGAGAAGRGADCDRPARDSGACNRAAYRLINRHTNDDPVARADRHAAANRYTRADSAADRHP
jgi:hypothetical protein